jgi:hypothetical protein
MPVGRPTLVKDKCLPHPYEVVLHIDRLVPSGGLPETSCRRPICARSGRVLLILVAEKVPLILVFGSNLAFFCSSNIYNI